MNHSLAECILPPEWRQVSITPIPKAVNPASGDIEFRPIANTSSWLKLVEKLVLSKLEPTLSSVDDPLQFAYKPNRATVDAVATLAHKLYSALDSGKRAVNGVFLDFSSAFNTIPRSKLLSNLSEDGVEGWIVRWLQ